MLIEHLRPTANLKWSPVYNLHITTKFIGEWPSSRLDELAFALRDVTVQDQSNARSADWSPFPNARNPRVVWAALECGPALAELASATESVLERLGIARESRPFSPHLLSRESASPRR